ncbi:ATP-binding cassette sub-family C member 3-like [Haliotis rubra]|uniref:ATP-binding cassette sub-family C member 3-like n=1 Tax=Haliotis rubra TaxID=36100 RepID=UPI001EE57FBB|nr:ATP-binding cassette sub-family C member 3-like [Haliotis rubra]
MLKPAQRVYLTDGRQVRLEVIGNVIVLAASLFDVMSRDTLSGGLALLVGLLYAFEVAVVLLPNEYRKLANSKLTVKEARKTSTERRFENENRNPAGRAEKSPFSELSPCSITDSSCKRDGNSSFLSGTNTSCIHVFYIQGGHRGQDGAGKSSLTRSLFRLIEALQEERST